MKIKLFLLLFVLGFCVSCMNLNGLTVTVTETKLNGDCVCSEQNATDYKPADEMLGQKRCRGGINVFIGNKSVVVPTDAEATIPLN